MVSPVLAALLHGPYQLIALIAGVVSAIVSLWGRDRSWLDRIAVALFMGYGIVVIAAALAPSAAGAGDGPRSLGCDFATWLPPDVGTWLIASPETVLMWSFLPLGVVAMLSDNVRRATTIAVAFAVPVAVELAQALLPMLPQSCSSRDLVASEMGMMAGLVLGAVLLLLTWPLRGSAGRHPREPNDDLASFFS